MVSFFSVFVFFFGSLSVLTPLRFFLSSRGCLRFFRFLSSDPLFLFRFVLHYTVIREVSPGVLGRLARGERMAAPPARPQEHFSITPRSRSLAQSGSFFLVDAGSFLDSARRRSGALVNFLHLPRSCLFGTNAAATFPTLFSFRALAAALSAESRHA